MMWRRASVLRSLQAGLKSCSTYRLGHADMMWRRASALRFLQAGLKSCSTCVTPSNKQCDVHDLAGFDPPDADRDLEVAIRTGHAGDVARALECGLRDARL